MSITHDTAYSTPKQYNPEKAKDKLSLGSTASVWKHSELPGVVIKAPTKHPWPAEAENKFHTEAAILQALGPHPRIVKYVSRLNYYLFADDLSFLGLLDPSEPRKGLLFAQAVNGDVTQYLKNHGDTTGPSLRVKWCKQAADALSHCHARGVLHCDLRPDQMLLDGDLNLFLCDFGGSENAQHSGGNLPAHGFFDPREDSLEVTKEMEVFGLGSCMYCFMTGHLPHDPTSTNAASYAYVEKFSRLLKQGELPNTSALEGGDIITKCWTHEIGSTREVLACYEELEQQLEIAE